MKNPAETPSPAGPNPRRRSSRPAKLISVVSCATTIRRPSQAPTVRPASVCTISTGCDRRCRQEAMDRDLARAITAKLADDQRPGLHHPLDQSAAHRRTASIPKIAKLANLPPHDIPEPRNAAERREGWQDRK